MDSNPLPEKAYRYRTATGWEAQPMRVITEEAVSLYVNGEPWLSFTCTPADLEELAVGFLYNENVIETWEDVAAVDVRGGGSMIDVWLRRTVERPQFWQRTSGCAGGVTSSEPPKPQPVCANGRKVAPAWLLDAMEQLLEIQELYRETGGVHCSALSDGTKILARAEDIGRHNTLDKLAGCKLRETISADPLIVLTTGRVSSEMLQKSARMGASVVVSRTSATTQSVALARELRITLVGYARKIGFLTYTHPERLGFKD